MSASILGLCAARPGPQTLLRDDAELASGLDPDDASLAARTLTGQIDRPVEGMERWSRLDRYGRALVHAVDSAIDPDLHDRTLATGMYVASAYSCLETNAEFDRGFIEKGPRRASPFLFPFTLPGSAAAEAAAYFKLTGPYLVFPGGPATTLVALLSAIDSLAAGTPRVMVVSADVLGPATLRSMRAAGLAAIKPPLAEASAALWVGQQDDPAAGPRVRIDGTFGPADLDNAGWRSLIGQALERTAVPAAEISMAISATEQADQDRPEIEAIGQIRNGRSLDALDLAWQCGRAGAALGLLAVCAALEAEGPGLVTARDSSGSAAIVIGREGVT